MTWQKHRIFRVFSWMFKRWYLWIEFIILLPGFWLLLLSKSMPSYEKCRILDAKLLILFAFEGRSFFLKNWFFCSRCHRNLTKKLVARGHLRKLIFKFWSIKLQVSFFSDLVPMYSSNLSLQLTQKIKILPYTYIYIRRF